MFKFLCSCYATSSRKTTDKNGIQVNGTNAYIDIIIKKVAKVPKIMFVDT